MEIFQCLSIGFVFSAIQLVEVSVLMAAGKIRKVNQVYGIAALVNITGNLILIPLMQAQGVAYINIITQFICCFGGGYLIFSSLNLYFSKKYLLKILKFTLWSFVFAYICATFITFWLISAALCLSLILLGVFLFKLIEIKDVKLIFKQ